MRNKKVIYATWFGDKGAYFEPTYITSGWDYVFITDRLDLQEMCRRKKNIWEVVYKEPSEEDSELSAKVYKILPHLEFVSYTHTIYIDSDKYVVDCNLDNLLEKTLGNNKEFAALKHRVTDCTYEEIQRQKKRAKDKAENFDSIRQRCIESGLPEHYGLTDNSILIRKLTSSVVLAMQSWWLEISNYCKRDQCSLQKVLYQTQLPFNYLCYENYKSYKALRYLSNIHA